MPSSQLPYAEINKAVTESITAQNTFTDPFYVIGKFNISISGTWVATVHIQRSFDNGSNWNDVDSFTSNVEAVGENPEREVCYRIGVKTGNYTSGTAVVRLSQ